MPDDVEAIPGGDDVSRLIDKPHKYRELEGVIWQNAFIFSSGVESLVWRKYKPSLSDVHQVGCERQLAVRQRNPEWTYVGCVTANVQGIRDIISGRGHGFSVVHRPEDDQGVHHAEIEWRQAAGAPFHKNDRAELRDLLPAVFGGLEAHSCD